MGGRVVGGAAAGEIRRAPGQTPLFPGSVSVAGLVLTSGVVSARALAGEAEDIAVQCQSATDELEATLRQSGLALEDIVHLRVYLTSREYLNAWNAEFSRRWDAARPARAVVIADLALATLKVELEAVAAKM